MRAARRHRIVSGAALGRRRKRTLACLNCGAVIGSGPGRKTCPYCQGETGWFDSLREARRWDELVQMQRRGEIYDLRRQVPFEIVEAKYTLDGRQIRYVADFTYCLKPEQPQGLGRMVIEDVKGDAMTALARLKLAVLKQRLGAAVEVRVVR